LLDYALRRLVMTFFVVLIIMTFLALLIQFVPGDPVRLVLGAKAPASLVQQVRHEMYLDKPVPAQVYYFFADAVRGNLGVDFQSQRPVTSLIGLALPHTVILALASLTLAGLLGIPLGVYAATHPGGWLDRITTVATISLITMPAYVAGLLLLLVFSVHWQLMPATGVGSLSNPAEYARHLVLPAVALAVTWIGYLARLVRTSMLEVLNERYILAARSQGVREHLVIYKYALRNAVIPTIAVLGVGLGTLLGGAIFVEVIFSRAGLGMLIYNAIQTRNFPIVRGGVLVVALLFVAVNLLTDFVYHAVDPRIRVAE
jgi:peptide/nickel transport system permease protein